MKGTYSRYLCGSWPFSQASWCSCHFSSSPSAHSTICHYDLSHLLGVERRPYPLPTAAPSSLSNSTSYAAAGTLVHQEQRKERGKEKPATNTHLLYSSKVCNIQICGIGRYLSVGIWLGIGLECVVGRLLLQRMTACCQ